MPAAILVNDWLQFCSWLPHSTAVDVAEGPVTATVAVPVDSAVTYLVDGHVVVFKAGAAAMGQEVGKGKVARVC